MRKLILAAASIAALVLAGPASALAHGAAGDVPLRRRGFRLALASRPPPA